jgi:hypothetical protein
MPADRRQCARRRIESLAFASIARGPRALIVDASERGVALHSQAPLLVQSCVEAKLDLAEGEPAIVAVARVVWSDGRGSAGLEFIDLSRDSRSQLQRWLRLNGPSAIGTEPASARAEIAAHDGAAFTKSGSDEQLASAAERALLLTHAHGSAIARRTCAADRVQDGPPVGHLRSVSTVGTPASVQLCRVRSSCRPGKLPYSGHQFDNCRTHWECWLNFWFD